ncbi:MAG: DNA-directed RNA polymerase subunit G [Desulfurococcales archaeon]|nr:DNA-directed RNA polymerase subunit G [Desulfurococcales archaeon]
MRVEEGLIECQGVVKAVDDSKLPNVLIVSVDCGDATLRFDAFKDLLTVKEGESVQALVCRERPDFKEGEDLVLWGYVMSKKKVPHQGRWVNKLLISLWGYLLVVESEKDILSPFSVMDKVYFKLSTPSQS